MCLADRNRKGGYDLGLVRWIAGSCLVIGLMGCATVPPAADIAANPSAVSFSGARGWESFAAPRAAVVAALNDSMNDLNLGNIRGARDGSVSRLEATTRDKERVVATIRSRRDVTQVTIRVGWFGDQPLTKALLERVDVRLGSRSPEAIPATVPSAPSHNPYFARDAIPDAVMLRDFVEAPYHDRVIPW
jgi:Protein of unknown function (DUF3568)